MVCTDEMDMHLELHAEEEEVEKEDEGVLNDSTSSDGEHRSSNAAAAEPEAAIVESRKTPEIARSTSHRRRRRSHGPSSSNSNRRDVSVLWRMLFSRHSPPKRREKAVGKEEIARPTEEGRPQKERLGVWFYSLAPGLLLFL